ncbi:HNH endonuclease family protein [Embleya hyalina]|uniref:Lipoprotein n=1 Tax=Embleya hyalina TaxID=516124 RepID=A0A401Z6Y0_9ACTN|nr:HNH endonuclease family protein [Embleya hyalina]GCE02566.1 lipoprotein [Embleya hyalina]
MRRRTYAATLLVAAALTAVTACRDDGSKAESAAGATAASTARPASGGDAADPLDNEDGTRPGLAPLTSAADLTRARALIDRVRTKERGPKTGYDREKYGPAWSDAVGGVPFGGNDCGTRDDILKRDGRATRWRDEKGCVVETMTLPDPYSGKDITFTKAKASAIQIDHVVPLSASWQMGAAGWDADKRRRLANDPLNLLAVDGPINGGKGDSSPATWLPPNKAVRCSYAVRYAQVSIKYELPVTDADKAAMSAQCGG